LRAQAAEIRHEFEAAQSELEQRIVQLESESQKAREHAFAVEDAMVVVRNEASSRAESSASDVRHMQEALMSIQHGQSSTRSRLDELEADVRPLVENAPREARSREMLEIMIVERIGAAENDSRRFENELAGLHDAVQATRQTTDALVRQVEDGLNAARVAQAELGTSSPAYP
jgi:chromosome segregation ATPase